MNQPMTVAVTTHVVGLGMARPSQPVYVALNERQISARTLVAEHVQAEVSRARTSSEGSLALHYILSSDLYASPQPRPAPLDVDTATADACAALATGQCLLMIDGKPVTSLDATLTLTEASRVGFVRLLPLIGG
jgi:hypothetical protein